ncbi:hypothetical protein [Gemella morbillorum]|uniref:hypothetical protein n=1 Tax=Gemella morbillorum TaxID=29391 RepID=UPI0028D777AC|nr:hypothetical protein [Gemella morbillorum]
MKNENLEKVYSLEAWINTINSFINAHNKEQKHLFIENGVFGIYIDKEDEHEIINALEKIKSNLIEQLKELGVEV